MLRWPGLLRSGLESCRAQDADAALRADDEGKREGVPLLVGVGGLGGVGGVGFEGAPVEDVVGGDEVESRLG